MIDKIISYKEQLIDMIDGPDFHKLLEQVSDKNFKTYLDYFLDFVKCGKCMRGFLVNFGYNLAKNQPQDTPPTKDILLSSICYEIFETGILAHDDIIDNSPTRRNRKSMFVELGEKPVGIARAICLGDYGIMLSSFLVQYTDFSDAIKLKALKSQSEVYLKTVVGELKDVDISANKDFSKENIFDMYYYKTALYSIIGPLSFGAVLGCANEKLISEIEEIGKFLGLAFQIKDDILGIFGDSSTIGKSTNSDIAEGKSTILAQLFMDKSTSIDKEKFLANYGKGENQTPENVQTIVKLLNKYEIKKTAENELKNNIENAYRKINNSNFSPTAKQDLTQFANYLISRNK